MRKSKFRLLMVICLVAALLGGGLTVFSMARDQVPTVTYDHSQKKFVFDNVQRVPGNDYPNLFTDFNDMMPGDSRTQNIRVKADHLSGDTVYLYLRTELTWDDNKSEITGAEADAYQEIVNNALEQITLTVKKDGRQLTESALEDGVLLGKFVNKQKMVDLEVDLSIPVEVGNELQALRGEIGWVFSAMYYPDSGSGGGGGGSTGRPTRPALDYGDHYAYIVGYPDGMVHPEKQITRGETATIFFRMLTEESRELFWYQVNPYDDVLPDDWYNNAISTLTNAGILNGYPDGGFKPNANITRAEFAAMAVRFFEGDGDSIEGDAFPDIKRHWANAEINLAYAKGLIEGYPDGTFKPDQEITRAEAMTIVNRVLERYPHKEHLLDDMIIWPDNQNVDAWYYADVQEATNSHTFDTKRDADDEPYEIWKEILPVRDWAALEKEWSEHNSSRNPGEVVSSKDASIYKD